MAGPATLYQAGDHASRPASGSGCVLYSCTDHDLVYRDDGSSWTTFMTLIGGSGGDIATDTIWDAAGDLAVGSGANTAARLAKGAAGGVLAMSNGAVSWNAGTSFPGSPATGDRYYRTDRGIEYFYDGTRWLSMFMLNLPIWPRYSSASSITTGTTTYGNMTSLGTGYDMYLEEMRLALFVNTGNGLTGSHYFTITFDKLDSANAATNISTITANSATASTWINLTASIAAVLDSSAYPAFRIQFVSTGTPSSLFPAITIPYRLIG